MIPKPKIVDNIKDLQFHIITIGYPTQGESVAFFIFDKRNEETLFSALIDCYEHEGLNKSKTILKEYKASLDYFIWTHPDEDHSVGIENIISDFGKDTTSYLLPDGIVNGKNLCENATNALNQFNRMNKGRKYNINWVSIASKISEYIFGRTIFKDTISSVEFNFNLLAPISANVGRKKRSTNKKYKLNDFSIAILVNFGELSFFFGGDIEDQSIRQIPSDYFEHLDYIKIPHHGSESSTCFPKKIMEVYSPSQKAISVTTVFNKNPEKKLPKDNVLEMYKPFSSHIYTTGTGEENNFGYVRTIFDVVEMNVYEPETSGNAKLWN